MKRVPPGAGEVRIGAPIEQSVHELPVGIRRRHDENALAVRQCVVDVGACVQQHFRRREMACSNRKHQGREPGRRRAAKDASIGCFARRGRRLQLDIASGFGQHLEHRGMTLGRSPHHCRLAVQLVACVDVGAVADAYIGEAEKRAILARRLSDALMYDVLFSPHESALFHGDPHAGNVFHVEEGGGDPYRIALIDWGLAAEFNRREREKMVQLMLGLSLRHAKRLANNVDVLVEWEPEGPEDIAAMKARMEELLEDESGEGTFRSLSRFMV